MKKGGVLNRYGHKNVLRSMAFYSRAYLCVYSWYIINVGGTVCGQAMVSVAIYLPFLEGVVS